MRTSSRSPEARAVLACPACEAGIQPDGRMGEMPELRVRSVPNDARLVDLRPPEAVAADDRDRRQSIMQSWYDDFGRDRVRSVGCCEWERRWLHHYLGFVPVSRPAS
jgi:hypothetical protein